jgi:hypothetical protein
MENNAEIEPNKNIDDVGDSGGDMEKIPNSMLLDEGQSSDFFKRREEKIKENEIRWRAGLDELKKLSDGGDAFWEDMVDWHQQYSSTKKEMSSQHGIDTAHDEASGKTMKEYGSKPQAKNEASGEDDHEDEKNALLSEIGRMS